MEGMPEQQTLGLRWETCAFFFFNFFQWKTETQLPRRGAQRRRGWARSAPEDTPTETETERATPRSASSSPKKSPRKKVVPENVFPSFFPETEKCISAATHHASSNSSCTEEAPCAQRTSGTRAEHSDAFPVLEPPKSLNAEKSERRAS